MKKKVFSIPLLFTVFLLAGVSVWLRLFVVKTTYEINQVNRMLSNAEKDLEQVKLKIAELKSPAHLQKLAREKFELYPPSSKQLVQLSSDR